jgi:hypothetical protein
MSRSISHQHNCIIGTVPDLRSAAIHKAEFRSSCCSGQANIWEELTSSICVIVLLNKIWWCLDAPVSTAHLSTESLIDTDTAGMQTLNASFNISYSSLLQESDTDLPLETNIFVRVAVAGVTNVQSAILVRVNLWKVFSLTVNKKAPRFFRPSVTSQRHGVRCHET